MQVIVSQLTTLLCSTLPTCIMHAYLLGALALDLLIVRHCGIELNKEKEGERETIVCGRKKEKNIYESERRRKIDGIQ
jgi:hypothetical protein